jgi:hypothetical protein
MTLRLTQKKALQTSRDGVLDLDDPAVNFNACMKLRGDLSGADFFFGFPGEAWAMAPDRKPVHCFNTLGFSSAKLEAVPEGYRIYSREVLVFLDPESGEILAEWSNPFLGGRKVEVFHTANDPVNGVFTPGGPGPLAGPYPYVSFGDQVVFQWNFFIHHEAAMSRADYPLYSSGDIDQHAELWGLIGRKSDILDPDTTSAVCTMSWSRVADWLPFMEMGNLPGKMAFHSHAMKLMGGPEELPRPFLDYIEANHAEYLSAPSDWNGFEVTSAAENFRQLIEARKSAGN